MLCMLWWNGHSHHYYLLIMSFLYEHQQVKVSYIHHFCYHFSSIKIFLSIYKFFFFCFILFLSVPFLVCWDQKGVMWVVLVSYPARQLLEFTR